MEDLSIVNVVGGGSIHRELDLRQVSSDFPHSEVEFEPESFAAAVIRYNSPKGTVMLYSSGKYSLAGAESAEEAIEVNSIFIGHLEEMLGQSLSENEFEVRYLVGTGDLGNEINLNQISIAMGMAQTEYEPEQFPGLFYRPDDQDWFCLLFASGKVVFSGIKDKHELEDVYNQIKNKIDNLVQLDTDS